MSCSRNDELIVNRMTEKVGGHTFGPMLVVNRLPLDELNRHGPLGMRVVQLACRISDWLQGTEQRQLCSR